DPFQSQFGNAGLEMVRRAGLESYFQFHETFAENVIPGLPEIQFAFIDASHIFDLTLLEFVLVDKKLAPGGVIGFHDLWMPSLRKVLSYILTNREYQISTLIDNPEAPKSLYLGFLKKNLSKLVSSLPKADRIFASDLLTNLPLLPNLTFIEKLKDDSRDWCYHANF
ncbi:class I SAM-dependent methyltransferase, partial [Cyanobium sp. BA20m-14]|uniref:class I SAM-dependent methyltransferase n=1 Tax=Cyanobium sp. BA20m-14 TaxID=2823703 RepID=UPI0020CD5D26